MQSLQDRFIPVESVCFGKDDEDLGSLENVIRSGIHQLTKLQSALHVLLTNSDAIMSILNQVIGSVPAFLMRVVSCFFCCYSSQREK